MQATTQTQAALPYPKSVDVKVFKDDGKWNDCSAWFMRASWKLKELFVTRITLGHYETDDGLEPAYTHQEWERKSQQLLKQYPDCVFIYIS